MEGTTTIPAIVGANIKRLRRDKGLRQQDLGEALTRYLGRPWSRPAVVAAEKGARAFAVTELVALAFALDVPLSALLIVPRPGVVVEFRDQRGRLVWTVSGGDLAAAFMTSREVPARVYALDVLKQQAVHVRAAIRDAREDLDAADLLAEVLEALPSEAAQEQEGEDR